MGKATFCDICYSPIKLGDERHVLAFVSTKEYNDTMSKREIFRTIMDSQSYIRDNVTFYDLCDGCKAVLQHFFCIRKDELEQISKQLERMATKRKKFYEK